MTTILVRVAAPTAVTALVGSGIAVISNVFVNLATEWKTNWAMWLVVAAATVISGAVAATPYSRRVQRCLLAVGMLLAVSSAVVGFWPTAPATDLEPALGLVNSRCMQVTAHDVRVFTNPESERTWTQWVTTDPRWVTSAKDCL